MRGGRGGGPPVQEIFLTKNNSMLPLLHISLRKDTLAFEGLLDYVNVTNVANGAAGKSSNLITFETQLRKELM